MITSSLAYKVYEKAQTNEKVHVWDVRVIKHLRDGVEVNDIDNKETGDWDRDAVLTMSEDELIENGFTKISET